MGEELEDWRAVPGHEGRYEVSSRGRVRSLWLRGRVVNRARTQPLVMETSTIRGGYQLVDFRVNGIRDSQLVHRLVLTAFQGEPKPGHEASHIDGDPRNNYLSNLEWATAVRNASMRTLHGTQASGCKIHNSRLDPRKVQEIRWRAASGESHRQLGRRMNVGKSTIGAVVQFKTWRCVAPRLERMTRRRVEL